MAYFITEACIGCTLCKRSCPVQAIAGDMKSLHSVNATRCVECGVCGRVCAKGAVVDGNGKPARPIHRKEWEKPFVDQSLCSACAICVDACGKDCLAISLPKFRGDLRVSAYLADRKNCVGCGICADICPLHAITMTKEGTA